MGRRLLYEPTVAVGIDGDLLMYCDKELTGKKHLTGYGLTLFTGVQS